MKHDLYKTGDADAPEQIKDSRGEVVLGLCRVCGQAEAQLTPFCLGFPDRREGETDGEYLNRLMIALINKPSIDNPVPTTNVVPIMDEAKQLYIDRSKVYGQGGFEEHGKILDILFPNGLGLQGPEEMSRWVIFNMLLTKICRYSKHMNSGGHQDSIRDLGVYSFIMEDFDARSKLPMED